MPSMKQPSYSRIHKTHDFDDTRSLNDDSGSDPGESLVDHRRRGKTWDKDEGDYDQHLVAERPGQLCPWRRLCSSPWLQGILNLVLILVILGLLFERRGPATTTTASTTITTPVTTEFEGNGDLTGFIPPAGQQIKMFVPNMSFVPENGSEFFTREVQEMWLSLVPPGLGYLNIKEPKKYDNLPHPLEGYGNKTVFTTSVTHQLHCLYNIVEVYSSLISGHPIKHQMQGHLPHCFEYLRQSIMCCGDTALEGQQTTFPDGIIGSDGWDAKHVCKDYGDVYDYLKEHRADDLEWI